MDKETHPCVLSQAWLTIWSAIYCW